MLKGTFDFYYFIPFSATLALAGVYNFSGKQALLVSVSRTLLSDQDEVFYGDQCWSWDPDTFDWDFFSWKEISAV